MLNCNCFYDDALTDYANQTFFLVLKENSRFYDFGTNFFASELLIF